MTGDDAAILIPSIMISKTKGDKLKQWLASDSVSAIINKNKLERALDSDMDNGVISHEYGHGISSRLTGGPSNPNCLYNQEQAGEGWSDFFCLYMTHNETGLAGHARGIGTWLDNEPVTGLGIRAFRYSTDMSINPFTYNSIKTAAIPHGVGSVWCTMLYDLYWNMIDKYGYDSNLYSGNGGNNRTLQLVLDGLKLQPCSPGFVDARDAIILADQLNNNGADSALIWSTFARRGLGFSARQGVSTSRSDGTEAFDMPSPSSGLNELNHLSQISFWPNPVNGSFEVLMPENARAMMVRIYHISGKEVYSRIHEGIGTVKVETSGIAGGIYILKAEANGAVYSNKMIITR
jgi:extracellular elastinolytic metalloproteinase